MSQIRLLIADDHPVVRAGLMGLLSGRPEVTVVAIAADGAEAVDLARRYRPDLVLLDLRMPKLGGLEVIEHLRREGLGVKVLVLTTYDADSDIVSVLAAGASGYLLKDASSEELLRAIRDVAHGRTALSPAVAGRCSLREPELLSPREIEVLTLLSRGESNKAIGKLLFISEATVKTHLLHIFKKLGVDDRTAAVVRAVELGILRLAPRPS
jgi:DNA-binding NarL/FixJ family response regulator